MYRERERERERTNHSAGWAWAGYATVSLLVGTVGTWHYSWGLLGAPYLGERARTKSMEQKRKRNRTSNS